VSQVDGAQSGRTIQSAFGILGQERSRTYWRFSSSLPFEEEE